ncbi:MAG TPA: hypothetical protein PLV25_02570 [Opitutales bacterium]|nr:hypothetical protein [Opitutales bacterium]
MAQIENMLQIFAKNLGFDSLEFNDKGVIELDIDSIGQLYLEKTTEGILAYLAREIPYAQSSHFIRALELVHPREHLPINVSAVLHGPNQLLFVTHIKENQCDIPTLEQAIATLRKLHDSIQK